MEIPATPPKPSTTFNNLARNLFFKYHVSEFMVGQLLYLVYRLRTIDAIRWGYLGLSGASSLQLSEAIFLSALCLILSKFSSTSSGTGMSFCFVVSCLS